MSIGTSIVDSIPTVGTTVHTYNKVQEGIFTYSSGGSPVDYPYVLTLRPSDISTQTRRFGATARVNPSVNDDPGTVSEGRSTISLNVDATLGATLTRTELLNEIRWFMGALLKATLLEALVDGSLQ